VFWGLGGRTAFLVVCLLLVGTAVAQAAAGDLDSSYGQGGVAIADFGHDAFGNALLVQGDGKVVVAGFGMSLFGTTTDVLTARFATDGTLDASYGQGTGKSQPDFGHDETGYGAALQPDGKILVAGDIDGGARASDLLVTRFNADGTLDNLFGQGGKAQVNVGGADFARAIVLRPDGRIDVAGYLYDGTHYHPLIAQFNNPTGTLDISFHSGAFLFSTFEETLDGIAVAPDGSLVATGGYTASIGSTAHDFVYEEADNGGGSVGTKDLGGNDGGTAVAVQPDGKILLAGYTDIGGTFDFAVIRVSEDGTLDKSFGTAGKEVVDLGGSDTAQAIALQPDGKILLAGTTTKAGTNSQIGIVRLLPNGLPDSTFGNGGISIPSLASAGRLQAGGIGLQPDGKIVVGGTIVPTGSSQKDLLVVRLQGDATANAGGGGGASGGGSSGAGTTGGSNTQPAAGGGKSASVAAASKLKLTPGSFAALASGPSVAPTAKRGGAALSFTLNLADSVIFTVQKTVAGRKVKHNGKALCDRPSSANRGKPGCKRLVSVAGSFSVAGVAGTNTIRFSGRLSGHKLPPGHYSLVATPTIGTTHGVPVRAVFTISG
jgi:uncharacterized delta-60 repeat protein